MDAERVDGPTPRAHEGVAATGYLVRCTVCGREDRTGQNPLRGGWPKCCGYTMRVVDTAAFVAGIDAAMSEIFGPVKEAIRDAKA